MAHLHAPPATPPPRLALAGPLLATLLVMLSIAGLAFHLTVLAPFDTGLALANGKVVRGGMHEVAHPTGRSLLRIHARDGQDTTAGEPVALLDPAALDAAIQDLKAQSTKTAYHLALVRKEAQAFSELLEQRLASRERVDALERQAAALELEAASVLARIAAAELEFARKEIRAPVSGVVDWTIKAEAGATVFPGETLARIIPYPDRITIAVEVPAALANKLATDMSMRVHVGALTIASMTPPSRRQTARIVWIGPQVRTASGAFHAVHLELATPHAVMARRIAGVPGLGGALLLDDNHRTFVEQLLAPLVRHLHHRLRA